MALVVVVIISSQADGPAQAVLDDLLGTSAAGLLDSNRGLGMVPSRVILDVVDGSASWLILLDRLDGDDLGAVYHLEDDLSSAFTAASDGEVDGHGFGENGVEVFVYCKDADATLAIIEAALRASQFEIWEIVPTASADGGELTSEAEDDARLPIVELRPVTVPPSWFDDSFVELRADGTGTVDGPRVVALVDRLERRVGVELHPGPSSCSP